VTAGSLESAEELEAVVGPELSQLLIAHRDVAQRVQYDGQAILAPSTLSICRYLRKVRMRIHSTPHAPVCACQADRALQRQCGRTGERKQRYGVACQERIRLLVWVAVFPVPAALDVARIDSRAGAECCTRWDVDIRNGDGGRRLRAIPGETRKRCLRWHSAAVSC
jgi:hypothetical protein